MANVYSKRLLSIHAGATADYYVPAGFITVVRCITAFNASAIAVEDVQLVQAAALITIWQGALLPNPPIAPVSSTVVDLRVVCNPGDHLQLTGGTDCDATVSGYELLLP